jgi:hypothetical protein
MEKKVSFKIDSDKLDELKSLTGISQSQELLNEAMTLLVWAVNERKKNNIVGSFDEKKNTYKEVILPALMH